VIRMCLLALVMRAALAPRGVVVTLVRW